MKFLQFLILLILCTPVWAHKVNVFAIAQGDQILVEIYFPDGKPAINSKITVQNSAGKEIFSGVADAQGKAEFPIPASDDLTIAVDAGLGHRSEAKIPKSELDSGLKAKQALNMSAEEHQHSSGAAHDHGQAHEHAGAHESIDGNSTQLEAVVQRAVNQAIKPLARQISEYERKAGITEIIGGIGYIFGILGLLMFLTQKKKAENTGE